MNTLKQHNALHKTKNTTKINTYKQQIKLTQKPTTSKINTFKNNTNKKKQKINITKLKQ